MRAVRLPDVVARRVAAYLAALVRQHVDHDVRGLYLVGSVALDDYQDGRSDIDLVAVTTVLGEPALDRLAAVHQELKSQAGPNVDCVYLDRVLLRGLPESMVDAAFSVDGDFRRCSPCGDITPVILRCLKRNGITLRGPEPARWDITDDEAHLRRYLRGNLDGYWRRWIDEAEIAIARKAPGETLKARSLSEGVLGVSRIAATLATGDIVSKTAAGKRALQVYPAKWHEVIGLGLAARDGQIAQVSRTDFLDALQFMHDVIRVEIA